MIDLSNMGFRVKVDGDNVITFPVPTVRQMAQLRTITARYAKALSSAGNVGRLLRLMKDALDEGQAFVGANGIFCWEFLLVRTCSNDIDSIHTFFSTYVLRSALPF